MISIRMAISVVLYLIVGGVIFWLLGSAAAQVRATIS